MVVIGGGFGGLLAGARLREAGVDEHPAHREGRRLRRHLVLEPLSRGAMCDVESYIYLPLLEEIGYIPKEKYSHAPEILDHSRAIGEHYDLYADALLPDRGDRAALGRRRRTGGSSRRTAATRCGRGSSSWPTVRCIARSCPGIPGIETFKGHTFHTSRWDYEYTGRRQRREPHGPAGQARRDHRHRRDRGAVRAAPRRRRPSTSTCSSARRRRSTCAATTGRPIPSGPQASEPGWQKRRMENFNNLVSGVLRGRGPRERRLDRHHRQADRDGPPGQRGPAHPRGPRRRRWSWPTSRRWSRSARASTPSSTTSDRRGAEAVLPPVLQAPVLPRRVPRHVQPAERDPRSTRRAGASSASPSAASWSTASSTSSTASSTPPASRWAPTTRAARATSSYGRGRRHPDREVGRRRIDVARHAQPRLPELLHHAATRSPASP